MKEIQIPFSKEMTQAILGGRKCTTARSEEKGDVGDVFRIQDNFYRIVHIRPVLLKYIRDTYYLTEGCESPEHFERIWRSLHRGHYTENKLYFLHFFAFAGPNDSECSTCPFADWDSDRTGFSCIHPDHPGVVAEDDLVCPLWEG